MRMTASIGTQNYEMRQSDWTNKKTYSQVICNHPNVQTWRKSQVLKKINYQMINNSDD